MRNLVRYAPKVARFVRRRGLKDSGRTGLLVARTGWMAMLDRRREASLGVSAAGTIQLDDLSIDSDHRDLGFASVPSPGLLVATMLSNIDREADLRRFAFVDFGSGKGRVLLVAAHFPFAEIVGVEFSPELHHLAEENIRGYLRADLPARNVRSICKDAADFDLPDRDLVLYFNNPFTEPIFARVLDRIEHACKLGDRKVYVLYQHLAEGLETDRTGNVDLLRQSAFLQERPVHFPSRLTRFLLSSYKLWIFESVGPAK
jgi:predicted RNA methylase